MHTGHVVGAAQVLDLAWVVGGRALEAAQTTGVSGALTALGSEHLTACKASESQHLQAWHGCTWLPLASQAC